MKGLFKNYKNDPFKRALVTVGVPVALQHFIQTALNLIDTIMIGRVSKEALAAVGLANQVFFLMTLLVFGINSGVSVYIAQFWGKKDLVNIRRTMGVGLVGGIFIGFVFFLAGFLFPVQVLELFLKEEAVVQIGAEYLKIVSLSYVFTSVTMMYSVASRGVEQARLPMIVSSLSILVNTFGNWILIFGLFGLPAMGARGAAIATLIARVFELSMLLILIYKTNNVLAAKFHELKDFGVDFVKRILKTALPVIINEGLWALGTVMYTMAMARINSDAVASFQVMMAVYRFFEVAFIGLGNSCQVVIGNRIGAGEEHLAMDYSKRFIRLTLIVSLITSFFLYILAPSIASMFKVPAHVQLDAIYMMRIVAFYNFPKMMNLMFIVGILRGGGDTLFAMIIETLSVWGIGVPIAFAGALIFKWPAYMVVAAFMIEEVIKSSLGAYRFVSRKWIKNVVEHI